jgi:hypothetical protein
MKTNVIYPEWKQRTANLAPILCALLVLFALPSFIGKAPGQNAPTQDITGVWQAEDVGFAPWTFKLKAAGNKLTGTVSQSGSSGSTTTTLTGDTEIYDGAISGSNISFNCLAPTGDRTIFFSGAVAGDVITFKRSVEVNPGGAPGMNGIYGASGATNFTAKRVIGPTSDATPNQAIAAADAMASPTAELPVPAIEDLARVDRTHPPRGQDATTATYLLKTAPHPTLGDAYVIVTDQTNESWLAPLRRLAEFHQGTILHVPDFLTLGSDPAARRRLTDDLRAAQPRFVAIAPGPQSFHPNMLLALWSVLGELGNDKQIPVFPGLFAAPDPSALSALVDHSVNYKPKSAADLRPFVIAQVIGPQPYGLRSLQKVRMMRQLFDAHGAATRSLVVLAYTAVQGRVQISPVADEWQAVMAGPSQFVKSIPAPAKAPLDQATLLLMFGHGSPGSECSLDVSAFDHVEMNGKIVMTGDCFSAAAAGPAPMLDAANFSARPGAVETESFAMLAVKNGADVVYAHMAENAGFPHLFPVLENWMNGLTVGEAYQRLINALLTFNGIDPETLASGAPGPQAANPLLYVIIGDPALQPMQEMK